MKYLVANIKWIAQCWGAGTFVHRLPTLAPSKKGLATGSWEPFLEDFYLLQVRLPVKNLGFRLQLPNTGTDFILSTHSSMLYKKARFMHYPRCLHTLPL